MDIVSHNFDGDRRRVEVFILQLPHTTTVNGIGPLRIKGVNVEVLRALAYLFIRRKRHTNITMFTPGAVIIGLVYILLPFMVMPLYSSIEKLDKPLLEAAKDLGASKLQTFIRIVIPLTMIL